MGPVRWRRSPACHHPSIGPQHRAPASAPAIGPITTGAIATNVPDASLFRSSRQFAAWLGLTPRAHSRTARTASVNKRKAGHAGLMLIVTTPTLDQSIPFKDQILAVREGIAPTRALREWFVPHQDAVRGRAALVPGNEAI